MNQPLRALLVEDSANDAELLLCELRQSGFAVTHQRVDTAVALKEALRSQAWDIVLSDWTMPGFNGLEALAIIRASGLDWPVILVSGTIGEDTAVNAMRAGANDCLLKSQLARLGPVVERELRETARRLAHRAAEEQVRLLSHAVLQAPVSIIITDTAGRIEYTNPKFTELTGYTFEEVRGQQTSILKSGHTPPAVYTELWQTIAAGREWRGELQNRKKNGEVFWELASISPIRDAAGKITHYLAAKLDITERKLAEQVADNAMERYRALFEHSLHCLYLTDFEGRFLDANPAALALLGYEHDDIPSLDFSALLSPEQLPLAMRALEEVRKTGHQAGSAEFKLKCKNGDFVFVEASSSLVLRDGQPYAIQGIARDLTARKAAERRIRAQADLIDLANEAIVAADLDRRISFWNHGAERLFGWSAAEMIGKLIDEVSAFGGIPGGAEGHAATATVGDWRGEIQGHKRNGDPLVLETSITVLRDEAGQSTGRLSISTDITEKKKIAGLFLRAQRLEAIGALSSGIAHDLNNVLVPILLLAPMLKEKLADPSDVELLEMVEQSATRGATIIRQLLTFSRGVEGARVRIEVRHVLSEMSSIMRETFPRDIKLAVRVSADLGSIIGDATQIHQVLMNLCVNARDAMPAGGTLRLTARNLNLTEREAEMLPQAKPGQYLVIEVGDTGPGIPPEFIDRIFEPFFTTKEIGKGTGLGLSTVLGIVKSHDGFVTVESEPGHGAEFKVYLRAVVDPDAPGPSALAAAPPSGNDELVLVVDDEASIRATLRHVLESHRYRVVTAADGREALNILHQRLGEIRLVLTDLMMPLMSGSALIRAAQVLAPGLKFVAMIGLQNKEQQEELAKLGVREILMKPCGPQKVLAALRRQLPAEV